MHAAPPAAAPPAAPAAPAAPPAATAPPGPVSVARPHLYDLLPDALAAHLRERGVEVRDDEARRMLAHRVPPNAGRDAGRNPLSRRLAAVADALCVPRRLELVERVDDPADAFVKYLFRSPDGALSEAVRIPLHKPGHYSVCLSSQVGCAMGCTFCATGRLGFGRHLEPWEMVAAFLGVRDDAPGRVTGAVFQGQGEPLHNFDNVIAAARMLSHPCGGRIRADAITISTVGLVPQIRRYAAAGHPFRLIVSLTSAVAERRAALLPVAGKFALDEVAGALRAYAEASGQRVTVAWVLLGGVNHDAAEIAGLAQLMAGVKWRLNLIDVNDARDADAGGFRRITDDERRRFMDELQALGVPIVRRYSGGAARHAACGMLAATQFDPTRPAAAPPAAPSPATTPPPARGTRALAE